MPIVSCVERQQNTGGGPRDVHHNLFLIGVLERLAPWKSRLRTRDDAHTTTQACNIPSQNCDDSPHTCTHTQTTRRSTQKEGSEHTSRSTRTVHQHRLRHVVCIVSGHHGLGTHECGSSVKGLATKHPTKCTCMGRCNAVRIIQHKKLNPAPSRPGVAWPGADAQLFFMPICFTILSMVHPYSCSYDTIFSGISY